MSDNLLQFLALDDVVEDNYVDIIVGPDSVRVSYFTTTIHILYTTVMYLIF